MKKISKRSKLVLGIVAVILVFLGYRSYCTFIREQNVFDQMYYSRVYQDSVFSEVASHFGYYRRLFQDMPQLRTPQRDADSGSIWLGNMVFESYDKDFLEDGHSIHFTFHTDEPQMYIGYDIETEDSREWYLYDYRPDKKTLTYTTSNPENTEMKNFLFDRVLLDWFVANKGRTRFSSENLGKYTFIDKTLEQVQDMPHITEVQFETYSIKEKQISFDDVFISYPVFVSDDSPFEETVNTLLFEELFCGQDEEALRNFEGCQNFHNSYNITFANEDIVSICLHIDAAQGGSRGVELWHGVTFSISEQRFLRLSDICTWEDLVQCVDKPEDLLKGVPEEWDYQYVADELPSKISWDKQDYFYLGPNYVGMMLLNRATSRQENWAFEVPFDWTGKEHAFGEG